MRARSISARACPKWADETASGLLKDTGHLPQLETPQQLMHEIWRSAGNGASQA